ncbi:MAG: ABC transporter ATP-binding protein [Gammaproteobacteria bacterium]|nr:MAG: ABC transporter ATP-binding protein [Gammaproteobacteria bacterium]
MISKTFPGGVQALDKVSLEVSEGEFFALLGPSGCGKTTLLRILAGFETPSEGEIFIDGADMGHVPPNHRPVNMVFQSYAVFPHMTVAENVAYGLKVTRTERQQIPGMVEEALELVRLEGLGNRMPDRLSGGQRQRVALARALVKKPRVLLLDEPLSALDAKLRETMQLELVRLQNTVGITFVIVTHDQNEALSVADRIAVIDQGRLLQVAGPAELYEYPKSRFVADFIGKMNLFEGTNVGCENGVLSVLVNGLGRLEIPVTEATHADVGLAVRPEKMLLLDEHPGDAYLAFPATVDKLSYQGSETRVFLANEKDVSFEVSVRNASRDSAADPFKGRMWVAWKHADTLILSD